jgi:hypothetical protein
VQLIVIPEIAVQRSASRRPVGQTVTLSGTVQPSKRRLLLVVERRSGKTRAGGRLALTARGGRFKRTYRFHSTGLFRFYVAFPGDRQNAPSQSAAVYVRATPGVRSTPQGGAGEEDAPKPGTGGGISPGGGAAAG